MSLKRRITNLIWAESCRTVRLCSAAGRAAAQQRSGGDSHVKSSPQGGQLGRERPAQGAGSWGSTGRGWLSLQPPTRIAPGRRCTDVALPGEGQGPSWPSWDSQRAGEAGHSHSICSNSAGKAILGTAPGLTERSLSTHSAHKGTCTHHTAINRENVKLRFEGRLRAIVFLSRTKRCLP